MSKNKQILFKRIIVVAMLVALCFAATFIQIKMPTGDMVHLGNFVMIIAALLLGGIEGGLVGSLGMGLYDLIFYTQKPSTIIRTFILKFLIGFIVGFVFRLILKKKINVKGLLIASAGFFGVLFVVSLIFFIIGDKTDFAFKTGLVAVLTNFLSTGKNIKVSLYIPIFSLLFAIGMVLSIIFARKLSNRSKAALFAITLAVLVNILGEFILRWLLEGTFNVFVSEIKDGFTVSLITATSKIPGSLITGFISVLLAVLIYEPVYMGVKNLEAFKDDTLEYDSDSNKKEDVTLNETNSNEDSKEI